MRFSLRPVPGEPVPPELRFVDQRMFGGLSVSPEGAELPPEIAHIARDPMDPMFDEDAFVVRVRRRASGIKRILLDQTVVSGVGNIYADEALWRSRLHGDRLGTKLRAVDVRRLLSDVREVMGAALLEGGTSFDALYVNVNGESGYFDRSLHAYGQEGLPCARCGTPIVRSAFMNRSSYHCPTCQRRPRTRRACATATGTAPVWSIGVHGWEGTHSLPHPAHSNNGSPSSRAPVSCQLHTERHAAISSGRGMPSR